METVTNLGKETQESKPAEYGSSEWVMKQLNRIKEEKGQDAANEWFEKEGRKASEQYQDRRREAERAARELAREASAAPASVPDITNQAGNLSENIEKAISKSATPDKSKVPAIRPENIENAMKIFQTKSFIFGKYSLTDWQEDIMTLIMEQLQGYMSKSINAVRPDFLGEINVRIDCSQFADDDKAKAVEQIEKLMKYTFEFRWNSKDTPPGTKRIETKGVIISTYHNYVGSSFVDITLNKWAFPFLLYYGKGIGANQFLKLSALSIPGKYAKRLYKMLAGYIDVGVFDYKISRMCEEFIIPRSYKNAQIKKYIIEPAVEAINTYGEFKVSAEFISTVEKDPHQTKPTADTIRFVINSTHLAKDEEKKETRSAVSEDTMENEVIIYLNSLLEEPYRSKLPKTARKWRMEGNIGFVHSKVNYYKEMVKAGRMTPNKAKNYLLKAISDETGTKLRKITKHRAQEEEGESLF